jgi:outer membrane murein-binding lipoprotein Lpp
MKKLGISILSILLMGGTYAQVNQMPTEVQQKAAAPEVSDQELEKFANAFQVVQQENQKIKQKMMTTIQEEGMEVQRFSEIQQSKQNPKQEVSTTEAEDKKLSSITPKLQEIQQSGQAKMQEKIEDNGLSMSRYQEISQAIQKDPELREKLQSMMEG